MVKIESFAGVFMCNPTGLCRPLGPINLLKAIVAQSHSEYIS